MLGALWGLGHSTGQLILGLLMVVLKDRFDSLVPALSRWGGVTVGLSLIAIGVTGLLELRKELTEAAAQLEEQPQVAYQGAIAPLVPDPTAAPRSHHSRYPLSRT